jgi:hypothetical protein
LSRHERVDGAIVNKDFQRAIKEAGGIQITHRIAVERETEELFDCGTDELYQETGGRKGDRSSLPKIVQTTYMANEIRATHELNSVSGSYSHDQDERHVQIVEQVKATSKQTRRWLPW